MPMPPEIGASSTPKRLAYLDGARVMATLAVISIHVSNVYPEDLPVDTDEWWAQAIFKTVTRWCVPLFVMMSGATLLDPARSESPGEFYRRRASRILLPLLFWIIVCNLEEVLTSGTRSGKMIISSLVHQAGFYHLYFLAIMIGLYLAAPLLQILVRSLSRSTQRTSAIVLTCSIAFAQLVRALYGDAVVLNVFNLWMPYLGYFFLGYALREFVPTGITLVVVCLAFVTLQAGAVVAGHALAFRGVPPFPLTQNYLSPMVAISSVLAFATFAGIFSLRCNGPWRWLNSPILGGATFGIYLMHVVFLNQYVTSIPVHPLLRIPLVSALVFIISFIGVQVIRKIPGLSRVVGY